MLFFSPFLLQFPVMPWCFSCDFSLLCTFLCFFISLSRYLPFFFFSDRSPTSVLRFRELVPALCFFFCFQLHAYGFGYGVVSGTSRCTEASSFLFLFLKHVWILPSRFSFLFFYLSLMWWKGLKTLNWKTLESAFKDVLCCVMGFFLLLWSDGTV